ncbi:MAG TPA: peptidase C13 [Rhodanobacter sp.]
MPLPLAVALLLAATGLPPGQDFSARVTQGRLAEAAATGPAYQKQLWNRITGPTATALKGCIASHAPADKSPFTLVADIQADGKPIRIEVLPPTAVATCMAGQFVGWPLPPPPATPAPYPIEIDFSIVP